MATYIDLIANIVARDEPETGAMIARLRSNCANMEIAEIEEEPADDRVRLDIAISGEADYAEASSIRRALAAFGPACDAASYISEDGEVEWIGSDELKALGRSHEALEKIRGMLKALNADDARELRRLLSDPSASE